jgi:hypothetical protein
MFKPMPEADPDGVESLTRVAGKNDAESAKRRLRGKPIPKDKYTIEDDAVWPATPTSEARRGPRKRYEDEPPRAGEGGRQSLRWRPTGKRGYKEGEAIRDVDRRHWLSPKRLVQGFRESGALGHKVKTGAEGSADFAVADLPDDKNRNRTGRLVAAFRQQQKDLERLAQAGKSVPESWGVHAGKDPRDLMRRLTGGEAFVYDSKGNEIPVGKVPVRGAGGRIDSNERTRRFVRDPLASVQGSKLNPANWLAAMGFTQGGTDKYHTTRAQRAALNRNIELFREVEERKIHNPNYVASPEADKQLLSMYQGLINQDSPQSRNLARTLLQSPYAGKLIRDIEATKARESRAEGRERSDMKALSRQENPSTLRYNEIADNAQKRGIPFKVTTEKGRNQTQVVNDWEHLHHMLDAGVDLKEIQEDYPEYFTMPHERGRGVRVADEKAAAEAEEEAAKEEEKAEKARLAGDKKKADAAKKKAAKAKEKAAKAKGKKEVGVKPPKKEVNEEHKALGVDHLPLWSRTGNPKGKDLREHLDTLNIPHSRKDTVDGLMDKLRAYHSGEAPPEGTEVAPEGTEVAPEETAQEKQEAQEKWEARKNESAKSLAASLSAHDTSDLQTKQSLEDFKEHALGHGVTHGKQGNYRFGEDGQHLMNKKSVEQIAAAPKRKVTKEMDKQTHSEALQEVLSGAGVYDGLSDKLKDDIKSGGDLSHWAHVFEWLTDGGDFSKVGTKLGGGVKGGKFRMSEDQPFDLAWALLKGA